jgi:hypothetical protein
LRIQNPKIRVITIAFNSSKEVGTGNVTNVRLKLPKNYQINKKFHSAQCLKLLLLMHLELILISLKGTLSQAINMISDTTVITTDPN